MFIVFKKTYIPKNIFKTTIDPNPIIQIPTLTIGIVPSVFFPQIILSQYYMTLPTCAAFTTRHIFKIQESRMYATYSQLIFSLKKKTQGRKKNKNNL